MTRPKRRWIEAVLAHGGSRRARRLVREDPASARSDISFFDPGMLIARDLYPRAAEAGIRREKWAGPTVTRAALRDVRKRAARVPGIDGPLAALLDPAAVQAGWASLDRSNEQSDITTWLLAGLDAQVRFHALQGDLRALGGSRVRADQRSGGRWIGRPAAQTVSSARSGSCTGAARPDGGTMGVRMSANPSSAAAAAKPAPSRNAR